VRLMRWARTVTLLASPLLSGCGIAPKTFLNVNDPAPIVRARSVGLSQGLPESQVVPALLDRLEDKDPVVRLAAAEELKKGTGRNFGFVPWANETDRARAVARWRAWWKQRQQSFSRIVGSQ
jgi:hypothetical protein